MNHLKILSPEIFSDYGNRPTVAIVGNGGVNQEDQRIIQDSNCVVRFNDFATRDGIEKTRDPFMCDILFTTYDLHSQGSYPKHVVDVIPWPFKAEEKTSKPSKWYSMAQPWTVNPYINMQLCKDLDLKSLGFAQPLPSAGLTALYNLKDMPCNFFVCGMNWYFDELTQLFQGYHMKDKDPTHFNHFYHREIKWVISNLMNKSNFNFSGSCLRLLNVAKDQLR